MTRTPFPPTLPWGKALHLPGSPTEALAAFTVAGKLIPHQPVVSCPFDGQQEGEPGDLVDGWPVGHYHARMLLNPVPKTIPNLSPGRRVG
ncbi:MAG: hypothetical protein GX442_25730 [Candidatus Riflebacteria bacterium]|nr:hypothetical protein [Candidatus Riflebacteria bacterium]